MKQMSTGIAFYRDANDDVLQTEGGKAYTKLLYEMNFLSEKHWIKGFWCCPSTIKANPNNGDGYGYEKTAYGINYAGFCVINGRQYHKFAGSMIRVGETVKSINWKKLPQPSKKVILGDNKEYKEGSYNIQINRTTLYPKSQPPPQNISHKKKNFARLRRLRGTVHAKSCKFIIVFSTIY